MANKIDMYGLFRYRKAQLLVYWLCWSYPCHHEKLIEYYISGPMRGLKINTHTNTHTYRQCNSMIDQWTVCTSPTCLGVRAYESCQGVWHYLWVFRVCAILSKWSCVKISVLSLLSRDWVVSHMHDFFTVQRIFNFLDSKTLPMFSAENQPCGNPRLQCFHVTSPASSLPCGCCLVILTIT